MVSPTWAGSPAQPSEQSRWIFAETGFDVVGDHDAGLGHGDLGGLFAPGLRAKVVAAEDELRQGEVRYLAQA